MNHFTSQAHTYNVNICCAFLNASGERHVDAHPSVNSAHMSSSLLGMCGGGGIVFITARDPSVFRGLDFLPKDGNIQTASDDCLTFKCPSYGDADAEKMFRQLMDLLGNPDSGFLKILIEQ